MVRKGKGRGEGGYKNMNVEGGKEGGRRQMECA